MMIFDVDNSNVYVYNKNDVSGGACHKTFWFYLRHLKDEFHFLNKAQTPCFYYNHYYERNNPKHFNSGENIL